MSEKTTLPGGIGENFRFLVMEVNKQLEETFRFLSNPSPQLHERIESRDDYIDNMKSLIEDRSFTHITTSPGLDKKSTNLMRSVNTIATNLERIADFAVNVVGQTKYLSDVEVLKEYAYERFFTEIFGGLKLIEEALLSRDMALAFRICHSEFHLDSLYAERMDRVLEELKQGKNTGDLVTTLFIFRYLERMGDSLLNIGEAIIFAILGERLKIHQYQALTDTLASSGLDSPLSDVEFESIWGTRSGCRIGSVQEKRDDASAQRVIFKEGRYKKLEAERDNIERWDKLMPGLPPKVFGFQRNGDQASILLEFLPGCTFQDVLMNSQDEIVLNARFLLEEHIKVIWRETRRTGTIRTDFIGQLRSRLEDVFRLHPAFDLPNQTIGGLNVDSLARRIDLLDQATLDLAAPNSVFIHGDFNVNNIIYDHNQQRLHYIDLHRSANADPALDSSVFLVSIFRLPVERTPIRGRLNQTALEFFRFVNAFARETGDETFQARLALGLVRSFLTSTRFEFNRAFARSMFLRSVYLMEKMLDHRGRPWSDFRLTHQVMVY